MRCEEIMRRDVVTLTPEATVLAAAEKMRETDVGFLPVCSSDGRLVGVVTDRDIVVRACAEGLDLAITTVAHVMSTVLVTVRPKSSLSVAERAMRKKQKARVPVVDPTGCLVGVLSLSDVVQYETPQRAGRILFDLSQRKYDPRTA